jgi:hypothetical protein
MKPTSILILFFISTVVNEHRDSLISSIGPQKKTGMTIEFISSVVIILMRMAKEAFQMPLQIKYEILGF